MVSLSYRQIFEELKYSLKTLRITILQAIPRLGIVATLTLTLPSYYATPAIVGQARQTSL